MDPLIKRIATYEGHDHIDRGEILRCKVGDESYVMLCDQLLDEWKHRVDREHQKYLKELERLSEDDAIERLQLDKKITSIRLSKKLDYNSPTRYQAQQSIEQADKLVSLQGLPCTISDSHAFAYESICSIIENETEPVTLVRVDRHSDLGPMKDAIYCSNYLTYLLSEHAPKIKEIINLSSHYSFDFEYEGVEAKVLAKDKRFTGKQSAHEVYGVPFIAGSLKNFIGKISGPIILDIDLDGFENSTGKIEYSGRGGRFWSYHTEQGVITYNQRDILTHPFSGAIGLRSALQDQPLGVFVHTERGYRNRYFWYKVEHDFLQALSTDDVSTLVVE